MKMKIKKILFLALGLFFVACTEPEPITNPDNNNGGDNNSGSKNGGGDNNQGQGGTPGSVIRPNRTDAQINEDLRQVYNHYRDNFLRSQSTSRGTMAWIDASGTSGTNTATISEAHGYGMKIFALIAGTSAARGDEQSIFDNMNRLRRAFPSNEESRLMAWTVYPNQIANPPAPHTNNATDGCLDNAYALLLAHARWGSNNTAGHERNYIEQARSIIAGLKAANMHTAIHRTKLGDWHGRWDTSSEAQRTTSRTSDWRPAHFRAFARATGDNFWNIAADEVYNLLRNVANPTTGLMPDFVIGNPARVVIASTANPHPEALVSGEHNHHNFAANACRVPWFLAMDFAHYGTVAARDQMNRISNFLRTRSQGNPTRIYAGSGFRLDGNPITNTDWTSVFFMAPFAAGMIGDSANQAFLNATYLNIRNNSMQYETEYGAAIRLLTMLLITGNWAAP